MSNKMKFGYLLFVCILLIPVLVGWSGCGGPSAAVIQDVAPKVTIHASFRQDLDAYTPGDQPGVVLRMSTKEGTANIMGYSIDANVEGAIPNATLQDIPRSFMLQMGDLSYLMGTDETCNNTATSCVLNYNLH